MRYSPDPLAAEVKIRATRIGAVMQHHIAHDGSVSHA